MGHGSGTLFSLCLFGRVFRLPVQPDLRGLTCAILKWYAALVHTSIAQVM